MATMVMRPIGAPPVAITDRATSITAFFSVSAPGPTGVIGMAGASVASMGPGGAATGRTGGKGNTATGIATMTAGTITMVGVITAVGIIAETIIVTVEGIITETIIVTDVEAGPGLSETCAPPMQRGGTGSFRRLVFFDS